MTRPDGTQEYESEERRKEGHPLYTYDDAKEPRTPETGHAPLLSSDEQVLTLPMNNGRR